jgi:hypothetical protein
MVKLSRLIKSVTNYVGTLNIAVAGYFTSMVAQSGKSDLTKYEEN